MFINLVVVLTNYLLYLLIVMAAPSTKALSAVLHEHEEDASQLSFPPEFENAETLLNSEVQMLLEHRKSQNENADDEQELSEVKTFS